MTSHTRASVPHERASRRYTTIVTPFDQLSDDALVRLPYVCAHVYDASAQTIRKKIKARQFPQPITLGNTLDFHFRVRDLRAWLASAGAREAA